MLRRLKPFRRVLALLLRRWKPVAAGLACVPLSALLTLWLPRLVGDAIDAIGRLAGGRDAAGAEDLLVRLSLVFAAVAVADAGLRFFGRRLLINASRYAEEDMKADLMRHVGRLPIAWFDRARTGDLISRFTQDVELLRFVVGPFLLHGGMAALVIPAGLYLMLGLSPLLTAAAVIAFVLLVASLGLLIPRLHRSSRAVQEAIARISQRAAEDFAGIRVLMSFARAREETRTMRRMSEDYLGHNMRLTRLRALFNLLIHTCRDLVALAVLVIGGIEVIGGRMTVGGLIEFLMYLGVIVWPLIVTGWLLALFPRALAAAERVEEIFALEPETAAGETPALRGRLEVSDLTFTYEGQDRPALAGVSFALEPGRKLGIVGPVGSGKSTLLALLLRVYDPPRGTVFVDGFDVLDLAPAALRRTFALAPQDPFLFSDTIRSNVTFGRGDGVAGIELDGPLAEAVHASALEQDVTDFPEGLESVVGERGLTLSGGQKQRVSMARALAAGRAALVLDDTLSAVDHQTEGRILERLRGARGRRTVLVAAHRLSAVADADLILVLRAGRVVESGTHADLLARGGYYARVWRLQREEAALEGPAG